jgi:hypothetical protein
MEIVALGAVVFFFAIVAAESALLAAVAWRLSLPPKLSFRRGVSTPKVMGIGATLIGWAALVLFMRTGWTIGGRFDGPPLSWQFLCLLFLPGAIADGVYVLWRRLTASRAASRNR